MRRKSVIATVTITMSILLVIVPIFLLYTYLTSLAPPKIKISRYNVYSDQPLNDGLTIEKLEVDSIGLEGYPVRYTTVYSASCTFLKESGESIRSPNGIEFYKAGNCEWMQDSIKRVYNHFGLQRELRSSGRKLRWLDDYGKSKVCPLEFVANQWYFLVIDDPRVTGVYFIIDGGGKVRQFYVASGVSPV